MTDKTIYLTHLDVQRLRNLLDDPDLIRQKPYLHELERELNRAAIVESTEIPADIVTMNSTVRLVDGSTGEILTLTLVYPDQANISEARVSVLAPVGMAILGCRQGETIEWNVPAGTRSLRIERILFQPEAAGLYTL